MKLLAVQNGLGLFATDTSDRVVVIDYETGGVADIDDLDSTLSNGGWVDPNEEPPDAAIEAAAFALGLTAAAYTSPIALTAAGVASLDFAPRDTAWDGSAASKRVRKYASSDGSGGADKIDWATYGKAFFWHDSKNPQAFGSYKLGFADVIDGKLEAVFRGLVAANAAVNGARGGVNIPEAELAGVKSKVGAYYKKAGKTLRSAIAASADTYVAASGNRTEFRLPTFSREEVSTNPTATLAAKVVLAGDTTDWTGLRALAACGDYPATSQWAREVLGPDVNEDYDHYGVPEEYAEGDSDDYVVLVAVLRNTPDGLQWEMFDPNENVWNQTDEPDDSVEKFPLVPDEVGPVLACMNIDPDMFPAMPLSEDGLHRLAMPSIEWDKVEALFAAAPFIDPQIRSQGAKKKTQSSSDKFSPGETKAAQADPVAVDATTPAATEPTGGSPDGADAEEPDGAPDADAAEDATAGPKGRLNGAQSSVEDPNSRINQYLHTLKRSISAVTAAASGDSTNPLNPPPSDDPVTDSSVPPLFLALVDPDDSQAVTDLIALIPANPQNSQVTAYRREDSVWTQDDGVLQELKGATPPPVVELSAEQVPDVISQIDSHDLQAPTEDPGVAPLQGPPDPSAAPPPAAEAAPTAPTPVAASAGERVVFVIHEGSLIAAAAPELPEMKTFAETGIPADLLGRVKMFAEGGLDQNRGNAERLRRYWVHGEGAAKIRWGTPGAWTRCYHHLSKYMGTRAKGYCANRNHDATGHWPAQNDAGAKNAVHASGAEHSPYATRYSETQCAAMASRGQAMSDGSLPIRTEDDIYDAIISSAALPLADRLVARDHIATRAYSIGYPEAVPADWTLVAGISENSGARFVIPLIIPEGRPSGDNRTLAENSLDCRDLPLPLLWQPTTGEAHNGSVIVGRIDHVERTDEGLGNAYGVFDTSEHAQEAERLVRAGMLRGVSADLDEFEAEIVDDSMAAADGNKVAARKLLINSARLMGATLVPKPAFTNCTISIYGEDSTPPTEVTEMTDALTASAGIAEAIPLMPPKEWFTDPLLSKPTHLSVSNEGRVFGHIAAWDVDHIGMAFGTKPPRSASNYAYFRTGDVQTAEGDVVPVGQLTLSGGHASLRSNAAEAVKHYDDTHSAVADLAVGEDQFGIWVSGALRPGVTPEQVRVLRASSPSGDWRPIRNSLELVAVCQVNVPGFPVARAMVSGGQVQALVAAGARSLAILQEHEADSVDMRLARLEAAETSRLLAVRDALFESRDIGRLSSLAASAQSATLRLQAAQAATRIEAIVARATPLASWAETKHPRDSHGKFREIVARLDNLLGHEPAAAGAISTLKKAADAQDSGDKHTADKLATDAAKSLDSVAKAGASVPKASLKNASKASSLVRASLKEERTNPSGHSGVLFGSLPSELKAFLEKELSRLQDRVDPTDSVRQSLEQFISGKGYRSPAEIAALVTKNLKQSITPSLLQ